MALLHDVDAKIELPGERIAAFCRRWHVVELALFGSVLRDDFGPASDVDVLVTFDPENTPSLFDHVDMQDELAEIFGRPVDLASRRGVEQSPNPFRRKAILGSARTIYEDS
ncbi:MAG TPA: nucleotidyltransferase family protein [Longimicrobiaceae bacterium]|nr:nucleotidyltransferase family protein [Longimicrobiaceae bacterium]